jgi:hypothetical protein
MSNPSNLYAEKIFSEHPIAMWALDDQADYLSLISNSKRDVYKASPDADAWTISGGSKAQVSILNEPMPDTSTTRLTPNTVGLTNQIVLTSSEIISPLLMNSFQETFAIGAYIFANEPYVTSYEIGYTYDGLANPVLRSFDSQIGNRWILISETFKIPQTVSGIKIVIKINSIVPPSGTTMLFDINGITFGQWSEEFLSSSSGLFGDTLPTNVPFSYKAITAKSYGLQDLDGYYFINNQSLRAKNSSIPIVYGSSNVTRILPNPNPYAESGTDPSVILPGQGFLNESGRYRDYTVEMWMRIDSKATTATRIFGPIDSNDGIYVDGPFIKVKIGDSVGAHPITEWYRPMLVDLKVSENTATMLINGEEVISISYSTKDLTLPPKTKLVSGIEKDNDWLGFYASENVPFLDIDCVAIYSYLVPAVVAKRRFAYGQATEFPENANTAYGGTSVLVDYSFADYTSNYSYPDIGRWSQGQIDNLTISDDALSVPDYKLPQIKFKNNFTTQQWYEDLYEENDGLVGSPFISFTGEDGHLLFENMNIIQQELRGLFGVFQKVGTGTAKQILLKIQDKTNSNNLEIYIENNNLIYKLNFGGTSTTLYSEEMLFPLNPFCVGLEIENLSNYFGEQASSFFGNRSRLSLLIGGDSDFNKTFLGKIYSVGFCNQRNIEKISGLFDEKGLLTYFNPENYFDDHSQNLVFDAGDTVFDNEPEYETTLFGGDFNSFESVAKLNFETILYFIASYTLIPKINFESISLDIAIDGYWEDYQTLTYFAQYVSDSFGKKYYDLDFIQFNIDYPALENFLDDSYLTAGGLLRSYVSFQYLKNNSSAKSSYFTTAPAPKNNVVSPGSEWITTKYEVVDGTIIYPPRGIRLSDVSIVTHLEWKIPGIITSPLVVKKLQYASQAFNERTSNPVGTRFGTPVFPYLKYGSYFDYKSKNPYRIYKGSTPYLYLTKNSGLEKVGDYSALVNRGFSIPVNQNLAQSYRVIALQLFLRYGRDRFPSDPEQIFEIESKDNYIKFFIVANDESGTRARIYGLNAKTGNFENGIAFYWNGKVVREPVITLSDWGVLGISFPNTLNFDSYAGGFRVTGSVLVNSISQYQSTSLQEIQRQTLRSWFLTDFISVTSEDRYDWDFWNQEYNWNGVLVISTSTVTGVNPSDIYKVYTGTNKLIVDDEIPLRFNGYEYNAYQGVTWQTRILPAV